MTLTTDFDKEYVLTGKRGQINSIKIPDLQYTQTGKLIIYRLMHDRDVKILITGAGKTTGTGKTTLAIHLARWINSVRNELFDMDREWSAEDYSFMDVWEYLQKYKDSQPGDCLITDELEYMTDARRWMSDTNVKFSQAWSILRYKNVVTIGTAPGLNDLEKRVKETADIWIRVVERGTADSYYMTFDDLIDERYKKYEMRKGPFTEKIHWGPIDDDPDYLYLKEEKEELGVPGLDEDGSNRITQSDLNQKERDVRNETVKELIKKAYERELMYPTGELRQRDIAEIAGVSEGHAARLKNELKKDGELPQEA